VPGSSPELPPDPSGIDRPHDILAADEFPPPAAPDADTVQARAQRLPPDPTGLAQPHDVLAAEEFPAPALADAPPPVARSYAGPRRGLAFGAGVAGLILLLRRRSG
jgi:hypothetical protein